MKHVWVIFLLVGSAMALFSIHKHSQNSANLAGRQFAAKVRSRLAEDPRFNEVRVFYEFSSFGNSLSINGPVASEKDSNDLKVLIESMNPPVKPNYHYVRIKTNSTN